MKASRLKQTLQYQMNYFGWSSLYVYGISVAAIIVLNLFIYINVNDANVFTGIGGVGFVHLLILGIGIRGDLMFFVQHGISRRTTFVSNLLGSLICSAALGLFCLIFNHISSTLLNFTESSFSSAREFFEGWGRYITAFFFAWQIGTLISLIFYRLRQMGKVLFSVLSIAAVMILPFGSIRYVIGFPDDFGDIIQQVAEGSFNILSPIFLVVLILGTFAAAGNYLLLRRAPIKE